MKVFTFPFSNLSILLTLDLLIILVLTDKQCIIRQQELQKVP